MLRSLFSGISGMKNHQVRLDVIGNNIANVNTMGYKTNRVVFKDIFSQTMRSGNTGQNPLQVGLGVALGSIDALHTTGNLQSTGISTDMALEGNGFFMLMDNEGSVSLTRAGNFGFDHQGNLVSMTNGQKVMGISGYFKVQSGDVDGASAQALASQTFEIDVDGNTYAFDVTGMDWDDVVENINSQCEGLLTAYIGGDNELVFEAAKPGSEVSVTDTDGLLQSIGMLTDQTTFDTAKIVDDGTLKTIPIRIDPEKLTSIKTVSVGSDGSITFDSTEEITYYSDGDFSLDKMNVATIVASNASGLDKTGDNLYKATIAGVGDQDLAGNSKMMTLRSQQLMQAYADGLTMEEFAAKTGIRIPGTGGAGYVRSGFLEMSNVDLAEEFSNMIVTQRGFQANSRIITTSDEILQELVNLKR